MIRPLLLCAAILLVVGLRSVPAHMQTTVQAATATREMTVYAAPGPGCAVIDQVFDGAGVIVVGRDAVGTWLRIQLPNADRTAALIDGWVWRGDLDLDPALLFSTIPALAEADACPDALTDPAHRALAAYPVIPPLSAAMREVFARGQELGIRPNAVTKVGDSLSADPTYLTPIGQPNPVLGPYDYLADTIAFYGATTVNNSVAARRGLTTFVAFDSMWADPGRCAPGDSPIACEYTLHRPAVSFILFGPNDQIAMNTDEFAAEMRRITAYTIEQGIIPVLSTFSYAPEHPRAAEAAAFNLAIAAIADEYDAPLLNLWLAVQPLPRWGLEGDDIHMRLSGYRTIMFADGVETRFGGALRNLITVRMLDEIRRSLGLG